MKKLAIKNLLTLIFDVKNGTWLRDVSSYITTVWGKTPNLVSHASKRYFVLRRWLPLHMSFATVNVGMWDTLLVINWYRVLSIPCIYSTLIHVMLHIRTEVSEVFVKRERCRCIILYLGWFNWLTVLPLVFKSFAIRHWRSMIHNLINFYNIKRQK